MKTPIPLRPSTSSLSRRRFLQRTSASTLGVLALPSLVASTVLGRGGATAPNSRVLVACIGTGPQGRGVMGNFLSQPDCRVVAVCDVKTDSLQRGRDQVNHAYQNQDVRAYADFREVLERREIDGVLIGTPDHWHVPISLAAARAGKDIYLEKPMGLVVEENQRLRGALKKHGRVFQFGTQQRSGSQFWQACQLVRSGYIGTLKHIDVWCAASQPGGTTQPAQVPPTIDYDFWLGPARYTPYTEQKCAEDGKTWWFTYDYALGFVAGWGVHPLDIAYWGCPSLTEGPLAVEGRGVIPTEGACDTAVAWEVLFRSHNGVTLRYRGAPNGYDTPSPLTDFNDWRPQYGRIVDHGTAFVGSEGWILVDRTQIRTSPESLVEIRFSPDAHVIRRSNNHVRDLLDCMRSRAQPICNIDEAFQADQLCHLSDLAIRLDRRLTWDPRKEQFTGDREANRQLRIRSTRQPWAKMLA
jgi:glucose-fructose oxidoreductase